MGMLKFPVDNFYKKRSISALSFDFVGFLRVSGRVLCPDLLDLCLIAGFPDTLDHDLQGLDARIFLVY